MLACGAETGTEVVYKHATGIGAIATPADPYNLVLVEILLTRHPSI